MGQVIPSREERLERLREEMEIFRDPQHLQGILDAPLIGATTRTPWLLRWWREEGFGTPAEGTIELLQVEKRGEFLLYAKAVIHTAGLDMPVWIRAEAFPDRGVNPRTGQLFDWQFTPERRLP